MLLAGSSVGSGLSAAPMAPLPPELEALVPLLASRRLNVNDFALSRQRWAEFHGYRKLQVRVRQITREGNWVRVDFDGIREGRVAGPEVFRLAWNEGEEGPAPFASNQRVAIWVSPEGSVDGFELGHAIYRWRHLTDGTVELQVLDEMVDGGTVLVRMIPDRYSGSEVGRTLYWKGEGLCTGAAGTVPLGLKIYPDDLVAAREQLPGEARKTVWVAPGMTAAEDEIRVLLRNFAGRSVVAEAPVSRPGGVEPFKIRLRAEPMATSAHSKRVAERQGSKSGAGWSRTATPAAAKHGGGSKESSGGLAGLFSGTPKDRESVEKPAEALNPEQAAPPSSIALAPTAAKPQMAEAAADKPAASGTPPEPAPEKARFDERWYDVLKERALKHRRQALDGLASSRSPGSAISQDWVEVVYESRPGEPLRAAVASLPQVPKKQFVPELRAALP